jgi:glutaminyl-peptide cyclotransferase
MGNKSVIKSVNRNHRSVNSILSILKPMLICFAVFMFSCSPNNNGGTDVDTANKVPPVPRVAAPAFNADSAYEYIRTQVAFGPRVPGSKEHAACAQYIQDKLKSFGLNVTVQKANATLFNGKTVEMQNITGAYKPERTERILLVAHWDTRLMADRDTARVNEPIDGANDGGSGVGVLLEIARVVSQKDPNIGIDFLFVDAEDQGQPSGAAETWCLGSQYWAQNVNSEYVRTVKYGILLDMVGARGAVFPREGTSMYYAASVVEKVWSSAAQLGYGHMFVNSVTGQTVDDNLFISRYSSIPCIDIVHYDPSEQDYGPFHHRHIDNMDIIEKSTLDAVGRVVLDVIYNEKVK